jgi:hypothetical protein
MQASLAQGIGSSHWDRYHAASSGNDRVYAVWRNLNDTSQIRDSPVVTAIGLVYSSSIKRANGRRDSRTPQQAGPPFGLKNRNAIWSCRVVSWAAPPHYESGRAAYGCTGIPFRTELFETTRG